MKDLNKGMMLSRQALAPYASSALARAKRIHFPDGDMWQMPREGYLDSIKSAGCVEPFLGISLGLPTC